MDIPANSQQDGHVRYEIRVNLFSETWPELSQWVLFREAPGWKDAGSELQLYIRKRWKSPLGWPSLSSGTETLTWATNAAGESLELWQEAEGRQERILRNQKFSPLICAKDKKLFCSYSDMCLPSCEKCPTMEMTHSSKKRCLGRISSSGLGKKEDSIMEARRANFTDEDFTLGVIGGQLTLTSYVSTNLVEYYQVYWGDSPTHKKMSKKIVDVPAADNVITIPSSTRVPPGATYLLVYGSNEVSSEQLAWVRLGDKP